MDIRNLDLTIGLVARAMDMRLKSHEITAANVANADTPGYGARQVVFESELARALDGSRSGMKSPDQIARVEGKIVEAPDRPASADGNSVDLDKQMARLAENTLQFSALSQMLSQRLSALKTVIDGGGM